VNLGNALEVDLGNALEVDLGNALEVDLENTLSQTTIWPQQLSLSRSMSQYLLDLSQSGSPS
jgi:hypothetical protein